jgi:hypothetical protein
MTIKYNFSAIEGAASAVERPAGAFQAMLDEGAAFATTGDAGATEAKPFLQYKFSTVYTTKIDWSEAGDQDAFNFTTTDTSAKGCTGDACNGGAAGILFGDGGDGLNRDGVDDLATYQLDAAAIGPGESFTFTIDPREVGAILVEYAVML